MTPLRCYFLKSLWFHFHKIFRGNVKLLSDKVLKVTYMSCRYLEPFRSYGEYNEGGIFTPPPPGVAQFNGMHYSFNAKI